MTKTTLNTAYRDISHSDTSQAPAKAKASVIDGKDASSFQTKAPSGWKAITESSETPSIIGDMLGTTESCTTEPTARDIEQAWLGDFMCGDYGAVRVSDNKNLTIEDHEEIDIPDVRELFVKYPTLQENTFPLLERLTALQKTIVDLIDVNMELLKHGGITQAEAEGTKNYLAYLKECMQELEVQLDIVDYYRQNELADRKAALETLEKTPFTDEQIDTIREADQAQNDFEKDIEDGLSNAWDDFIKKYT